MNLPDVKAGMTVLAEHIQRINEAIKKIRLRPGTGYYLRESSGGTSIVLPDSLLGQSGGGIPCPFRVTDASSGETLKVQVQWGLIYNMLPTGMFFDNNPPLEMTINASCFLYSAIVFNTSTLMPVSISFTTGTTLKTNTSTTQFNLIAKITVEDGRITSIVNRCIQPFPSPCSLGSA